MRSVRLVVRRPARRRRPWRSSREMATSIPPDGVRALVREHPRARRPRWRCGPPTRRRSWWSGTRDILTPVWAGRTLARTLPDAEFVVLPRAGHQLMQERPDEVAELIDAFVARIEGDRAQRGRRGGRRPTAPSTPTRSSRRATRPDGRTRQLRAGAQAPPVERAGLRPPAPRRRRGGGGSPGRAAACAPPPPPATACSRATSIGNRMPNVWTDRVRAQEHRPVHVVAARAGPGPARLGWPGPPSAATDGRRRGGQRGRAGRSAPPLRTRRRGRAHADATDPAPASGSSVRHRSLRSWGAPLDLLPRLRPRAGWRAR